MRNLIHLAGRLYNTPLLITSEKLSTIRAVFDRCLSSRGAYRDDEDDDDPPPTENPKTAEGIAVISILGTLVHRSAGMAAMSGMLSYAEIDATMNAAMTDHAVKGIVLDIDSCGGEVSGCFDLSDKIAAASKVKPIYAVSNESMYSAAYALGSAASKLYIGRTAGAGSIGVIITHCDMSEADKQDGLKYTEITSGARKADFSPHKSLSKEAHATLKADVDRCASLFFATVARNRGVSVDSLAAMEAGLFFGEDAIAAGLADKLGGMEEALRDMAAAVMVVKAEAEVGKIAAALEENAVMMGSRKSLDLIVEHTLRTVNELSGMRADSWLSQLHAESVAAGLAKQDARLQVRSAPALQSARRISGCFAPYGQLSTDIGGFREVYEPGCFAESMASDDIRALFNHNPDYVLGRASAGTVGLSEDARGSNIEIDAPETNWADDLLVSMGRRDITQMSSAFYIEKASWETRAGVGRVRHIEKARLVEVSIHTRPAYEGTTAEIQQNAAVALPDVTAETSHAALTGPQANLEVFRQRFHFAQYV